MPSAKLTIDVAVPPAALMQVLVDFEHYPDFLDDIVATRIVRREPDAWEVAFEIDVIRTLRYTLRLQRQGDSMLSWSLVEGIFHSNDGCWTLEATEAGTRATYEVDLKTGMFVPGSVLSSLVGRSLPALLAAFRDRAEALSGRVH